MAYNNGIYPTGFYVPQFTQAPNPISQTNSNSVQQPNSNIIWVCGEAGAKSYLVAPNTTVQLWDSEANVIYLKSADASGMPSIKILDYTIRGEDQHKADVIQATEYATKADIEALRSEMNDIRSGLNSLEQPITKNRPQKNNSGGRNQ